MHRLGFHSIRFNPPNRDAKACGKEREQLQSIVVCTFDVGSESIRQFSEEFTQTLHTTPTQTTTHLTQSTNNALPRRRCGNSGARYAVLRQEPSFPLRLTGSLTKRKRGIPCSHRIRGRGGGDWVGGGPMASEIVTIIV